MKRADSYKSVRGQGPCAIAIGTFDGVHVGHAALLAQVVDRARALRISAAALTFYPHPLTLSQGEHAPRLLRSLDRRMDAIAACGIDRCIVQTFDADFARLTTEQFVDDVLARIPVVAVLVGRGFTFGRGKTGTFSHLAELCQWRGIAAHEIETVSVDGEPVSSSRIRHALTSGDLATATTFLGRPYVLDGTVVHGQARGRTLGFPTANLDCGELLIPAHGIYAARVFSAAGPPLAAALFVGPPATFNETNATVEAYVLDFPGGDLYGTKMALTLVERLRGVEKFPNSTALAQQIQRDVERVRAVVQL
jgi:riboflavin kinase / FMN adenylyltransferase